MYGLSDQANGIPRTRLRALRQGSSRYSARILLEDSEHMLHGCSSRHEARKKFGGYTVDGVPQTEQDWGLQIAMAVLLGVVFFIPLAAYLLGIHMSVGVIGAVVAIDVLLLIRSLCGDPNLELLSVSTGRPPPSYTAAGELDEKPPSTCALEVRA